MTSQIRSEKKVLAVWASNFLLKSFRTWFGISGALCNNARQPSLLASFSCAVLGFSSVLRSSLVGRFTRKSHLQQLISVLLISASSQVVVDLRSGVFPSVFCVFFFFFFGWLLLLMLVSAVQSAVSALRSLEKPVVTGYVVSVSGGIS